MRPHYHLGIKDSGDARCAPAGDCPFGRRANDGHRSKPHYELAGKVVQIADGDTMTIPDGADAQHTIRLAGIDAPEKGQAFGTKAWEALAGKCSVRPSASK